MGHKIVAALAPRAERQEKQTGKLTFSETDTHLSDLQRVQGRLHLRSKDQTARVAFRVGLAALCALFEEDAF